MRLRLARRPAAGTAPLTDVGPDSTVAGLDEQEIAVLRQVGVRWGQALGGRAAGLRALPVDPGLHRFPRSPVAGRGGRFATVDFVAGDETGEVVATSHAGALPSGSGPVAAVRQGDCVGRCAGSPAS